MNSQQTPSATADGTVAVPRGPAPSPYSARLAGSRQEIEKAQRLRFEVFNLEMDEGLRESYATGLDQDVFDAVCDHLIVEERSTGMVVGTYRLQTGATAASKQGYYSEQEFDFSPYEAARSRIVELGRACVHLNHRNFTVLSLLWKGIANYARERAGRYLIGCSSLTSQDPGDGVAMYHQLSKSHLAEPIWRTVPQASFVCPDAEPTDPPPRIPKLLAAYLAIGARICGPPAIDREFKTIDFLTIMDLQTLPPHVVQRYLS
ncbi:MAG: GNAT family N-acetyltransferase [Limisphaerales bacterium]